MLGSLQLLKISGLETLTLSSVLVDTNIHVTVIQTETWTLTVKDNKEIDGQDINMYMERSSVLD